MTSQPFATPTARRKARCGTLDAGCRLVGLVNEVHLRFAARSFLHRQVRSMVGSLVEVGAGRWSSRPAASRSPDVEAIERDVGRSPPLMASILTDVLYPGESKALSADYLTSPHQADDSLHCSGPGSTRVFLRPIAPILWSGSPQDWTAIFLMANNQDRRKHFAPAPRQRAPDIIRYILHRADLMQLLES